jgi:chemotaxis protein MotA
MSATVIGVALAIVSLVTMMLLEGASPLAVILLPPMILVFGATFGAAVAGAATSDVRKVGSWFRIAFTPDRVSQTPRLVDELTELATMARKEGMLPLESRARSVADPFLRRGLQLAIDAVPIEQVRRVLAAEIEAQRAEDRVAARFFLKMGGYAPTIGIIGTVVGLVQVLQSLEKPEVLGPLVASAFIATLWGVLSANFIWLPMAAKIRRNSELRTAQMELLLLGVAEILAGTNPRALRTKLWAMLPPSENGSPSPEGSSGDAALRAQATPRSARSAVSSASTTSSGCPAPEMLAPGSSASSGWSVASWLSSRDGGM